MFRTLAVLTFLFVAVMRIDAQTVEFATSFPESGEFVAHEDIRNGGVLETSLDYHRTPYHPIPSPQPNIMPANGAYGYGFPVTTYRWGWFGASRYYPRVQWFKGYYNDCVRCGYRQGY